jgi:hypothetical protein
MAAEWSFIVPAKRLAIFNFVSNGSSKKYNFFQVWVGTELKFWFGIVPSYPNVYRIAKEKSPIQYTLKAYAQVPGTTTVTRSDIDAQVMPPEEQVEQEWLLHVRNDEGKDVQVTLLVAQNDPPNREPEGDGRMIYEE